MGFSSIEVRECDANWFHSIGKEWLLICCEDRVHQRENMMTASWGGVGILWNLPVCFLFVRPQRYTHKLLTDSDRFSVCILPEELRDAHRVCGSRSGRDTDKFAETGLTEAILDGVKIINESKVVLIVKKMYADCLKKANFIDTSLLAHYPTDDFHSTYICKIEKMYIRDTDCV